MPRVCFRLPGRAEVLSDRLARLLPAIDRETRRRWIAAGTLFVDGRPAKRLGQTCRAGARIEIEAVPASALTSGVEDASADWLAWVDAPAADSGSIRLGGPDHAELDLELRVLRRREGLAALRLHVGSSDARADSRVDRETVCRALSRAGMPVVGDLIGAGLGVPGGPRVFPLAPLAVGSAPSAASVACPPESAAERAQLDRSWPEEPAWPGLGPQSEPGPLRLRVSDETARALDAGHPWILADPASDPAETFAPGSRVRVESRQGRVVGWAHVEADRRLAARVWAHGDCTERAIASLDARVARALARRRSLLAAAGGGADESGGGGEAAGRASTNAFRLVHGEADDLPGLFIDRLGSLLRARIDGRACEGFRREAIDALQRQLPTTPDGDPWSLLEVLHLELPRSLRLDSTRWRIGGLETLDAVEPARRGGLLRVVERGLHYWVDPGWDEPQRSRPGFGLFLDQRENRARLDPVAASGGRWLNLFAHTGAFSVSLLAAGAEAVVSVDLSAPYLARLEANLEANLDRGVDPARHESVRGEGRRYLETLDPAARFAGIVVDPPTAAAAGRRFWSVRRDLTPLLALCLARLEPGGTLLVTQNQRGGSLGLDRILEQLAAQGQRRIAALDPAPPGVDFPSRPGFPEGESFEGWLLRLT